MVNVQLLARTPSSLKSLLRNVVHFLLFLLALLGPLEAAAQANFSNLLVSPTSGTVDSSGKLTVTFSGRTSSSTNSDAVYEVDLMEGSTVLGYQTFPVSYNPRTGFPVNTTQTINVSAGLSPGTHTLFLRSYLSDSGLSSDSQSFVVTVSSAAQTNAAAYVSQSVPSSMLAGQSYNVSVTMRNNGSTTWSAGGSYPYRLGAQNPGDNYTWGFNRVDVPTSVAPGSTATFNFTVTAPSSSGTYNFQWRMVQEYLEWFGDYAPNVPVQVTYSQPTATFDSPSDGAVFSPTNTTAVVWFSGSASAGSGASLSSVQLLEGGVAFASGTTGVITGSKALSVGSHTIELRVTDSHNQVVSAYRTVRVTAQPPTASFTSPSDGGSFTTTSSTASVSISASGTPGTGASISQLNLYVDGALRSTVNSSMLSTTVQLAPGAHTLGVEAVDNFGTMGSRTSISVSVVASTPTPPPIPTAVVSTPANYSYFVTSGSTAPVTVQGEANAVGGSPITKIELIDQGSVIDTKFGVSSYSNTLNLATGLHGLALRATNAAGGVGTSPTVFLQIVAAKPGDSASFMSQDVPTSMRANQPYTVTVRMLNDGTNSWSDSANYRLGAQNPQDNRTFGGRAFLSNSVATGQIGVFTFQVVAPSTPGTYNFQWQMLRESVAWFGSQSSNIQITVTNGSGPSATLAASPTNVRVSGTQAQTVSFSGSGASSGGTVTKLELFQDSGRGYGMTPVSTATGGASALSYSYALALPAGTYAFKLRATDSLGIQTDSAPVIINVTNSSLLGTVSGVRTNAAGNPELFGWVCQPGNAAGLPYKVLLDAPTPDAGGIMLTSGTAGVSTESDSTSVQLQCNTPGAGHHFVVDLSSYVSAYAGRALFLYAETADGVTKVALPCADNNCTMPGTLRVGLTHPSPGDVFRPTAFLRMQLSNFSGTIDEIGFMVDGQWFPAQPDSTPDAYSVSLANLAVRSAPYTVYAKVRQGKTTVQSVAHQFYVGAATATTVAVSSPTDGVLVGLSGAQTLSATVSGPVTSVKFYINDTQLNGSATGSGSVWSQGWTPPTTGTYRIYARAYDANGTQVAQSSSVTITATANSSSDKPLNITVDVPQLNNSIGGTLPGTVSVDSAGGAAYQLPLKLPPGIRGMVPSLSLNYDSNSPVGSAGLGWSIGGISKIDRCGKTLPLEKRTDSVRFMYQDVQSGSLPVDRLCLDGQRLVLVNGNATSDSDYWSNSAEYRTEAESFTRVTAMVVGGKRAFKVETKDGRTSYYGDTNDSYIEAVGRSDGLAHRWYVSHTTDRSGNVISYTYNEDVATGESNPATVSWGANTFVASPAFARVTFSYVPRKAPRTSYIAGSVVSENLRLDHIDTTVDTSGNATGPWAKALTYTFGYGVSPSSGRDVLKSVTACDNTGCLPSTTFNYGEPDLSSPKAFQPLGAVRNGPNFQLLQGRSDLPAFNALSPLEYIRTGDFNGDGKMDIIERYRQAGNGYQQHLYESNADGTGWNVTTPLANIAGSPAIMEVGDFDGDGLPDLIIANYGEQTTYPSNWRLCLAKDRVAGNFTCQPLILRNVASSELDSKMPLHAVRDFNADGKDDLFIQTDTTTTHHSFQCLSNGATFDCHNVTGSRDELDLNNGGETSSGNVYTDVDGDGRVDMLRLTKCVWTIEYPETKAQWHCGAGPYGDDMGGITVYNEPEHGGVYFNTGWNQFPNKKTAIIPPMYGGSLTGDLNADGYTDMVFGSVNMVNGGTAGTMTGRLCRSFGDSGADCRNLPPSNYPARDHLVMTLGDFDGDGVYDILRPLNDAWSEHNITGYLLCHLYADRDAGGVMLAQRCEEWNGPVFYSLARQTALNAQDGPGMNGPNSWFYGDFDGDGKSDFVTYLGNGQWQIYSAAKQSKPSQALDRLISVTNGIGNTEQIDYALANDSTVYRSTVSRPDGANATGKLAYPTRPLVKAIHRGNGIIGTRDTTYSYARMAMDSEGRGSLGFAEVTATDVQRGITTTTWPCLTFPHIGAECASRQVSTLGATLDSRANVWSERTLSYSSGAQTKFAYLSKSTVVKRDLGNNDLGTTVTTTLPPDEWGNVLDVTTVSSSDANPSGWTDHRVMTYDNDSAAWRLGELRINTQTRTNDYNSISRQTSYTYDANGLLRTETRESSDVAQKLTTTFDRTANFYGLVGKTILSWIDAGVPKSRTVSDIGYTPNGRFINTVTNALGHVEQRAFDARTGAIASVRSANQLTTNSTSDGFGRVLTVTTPDSTITETYYKSCSTNCPAGAGMVTIQQTKHADETGIVLSSVPKLQYSDTAGHAVRAQTWGFDGRQVVVDTVYDSLGRAQSVYWPRFVTEAEALAAFTSSPTGAVLQTQTIYDELDRPWQVQTLDELGNSQWTTHTWQGLTHFIKNPKQQQISEKLDVWGKLASTVDANGKVTAFAFDAFGNLARTTDPLGNVVTVTYDTWGRRKQLDDPDLGRTTYDVDPLGQIVRQVSPMQAQLGVGKGTVMRYDDLGRMISRVSDGWQTSSPAT